VDTVTDHGEYVTVGHTAVDGTSATAQATRAFICIGFCPNVEGIGLDAAGVRV
jgi:pyruvate/2-oxoglutarate dehydrogenase complex dihydrolipoamide dehydrogenase (E3) component